MNWRWKHIIVCTIIGIALGVLSILRGNGLIGISFPLVVNLLYWGFRKARVVLGIAKTVAKKSAPININVVRGPGQTTITATKGSPLYWIFFYFIAIFLAFFVGFYAFPNAIYKAIKKAE